MFHRNLAFPSVLLTPKACFLLRRLGGIAFEYKAVGNLGLSASSEEDAAAVASLQRIHNWICQYILLTFLLVLHVFPLQSTNPPYSSSAPDLAVQLPH